MATVQGDSDPAFEKVRALLQSNVESGAELGASIAVNIDGKLAVDIYGGYVDAERTKPWTKDTIVNVWSSTKTVITLAVLILHDRGLLDINENVAKYWPEFAVNGKQDVKVRQFLSHTSGVSGWENPVTVADIYDLQASTQRLVLQAPWWEPGTASGYHSLNMGHLIGELVRRVSGKSLTAFVADEIARPLGADFQIGALEADWPRITDVIPPPPIPFDLASMDQNSVIFKTFTGPAVDAATANTPEWRRAEIGAANGHGNARSLVRMLSPVSLGGSVDGHRLLSPETIDLIFQVQADGIDLVLKQALTFGIGYGISGPHTSQSVPFVPRGPGRRVAFWGGWGGSIVIMDVDKRATISYTMNKMGAGMTGSDRTVAYVKAIYETLDSITPGAN